MKLPQLSLRELFLLVVIAAMSCGWWREWQRPNASFWKSLAEGCIEQLKREGCDVQYNEVTREWAIIAVVAHPFAGDLAKQGQKLKYSVEPIESESQ